MTVFLRKSLLISLSEKQNKTKQKKKQNKKEKKKKPKCIVLKLIDGDCLRKPVVSQAAVIRVVTQCSFPWERYVTSIITKIWFINGVDNVNNNLRLLCIFFTLSTTLINQIFVYHSPTDAAPQFLEKVIPLTLITAAKQTRKPAGFIACHMTAKVHIISRWRHSDSINHTNGFKWTNHAIHFRIRMCRLHNSTNRNPKGTTSINQGLQRHLDNQLQYRWDTRVRFKQLINLSSVSNNLTDLLHINHSNSTPNNVNKNLLNVTK